MGVFDQAARYAAIAEPEFVLARLRPQTGLTLRFRRWFDVKGVPLPSGPDREAVYFLTGRKLKRLVGSRDLREAATAAAGIPAWLFEASYDAVGDLAETIALLLPPPLLVVLPPPLLDDPAVPPPVVVPAPPCPPAP